MLVNPNVFLKFGNTKINGLDLNIMYNFLKIFIKRRLIDIYNILVFPVNIHLAPYPIICLLRKTLHLCAINA